MTADIIIHCIVAIVMLALGIYWATAADAWGAFSIGVVAGFAIGAAVFSFRQRILSSPRRVP